MYVCIYSFRSHGSLVNLRNLYHSLKRCWFSTPLRLQHETNSTPKVKSKLETTIINPNMLFQIYISMEYEREKVISTLDDHDAELSMKC